MVCSFLPTMPAVKNYGASSTLHVFNCSTEDKRVAIFLSQLLQQGKLKMPLTQVSGANHEQQHLRLLAPAPLVSRL